MKKKIKGKQKGFALLTVLLLTALILILLISLVSISSQTLYQATIGVEKNSITPIAETAVNEVLIKMQDNKNWGTTNEKLYMRAGEQDPNVAGVNPVFAPNSKFSFQGKSCYYVSFDPGDTSFNGTKYYSVNNLGNGTAVPGWRGTDIPPYSASIVVSIAVGNTVKHIEAIVTVTPSGDAIKQGSRGQAKFKAKEFIMEKVGGSSAPEFTSSYGTGGDISVNFDLNDKIELKDGSIINSTGKINSTKNPADPNSFNENVDPNSINVPMVPITDLVSTITFEPVAIPSGTYKKGPGQKLIYTPDDGGPDQEFAKDTEVIPGFLWKGEEIEISKNLMVEYDPPNGKTGNFKLVAGNGKIKNVIFTEDDISIYAPGDTERDYTSITGPPFNDQAPYLHGNIFFDTNDEVLKGKGNIYAGGSIDFDGKKIDAGAGSDDIALYAGGDINVDVNDELKFNGLIYTFGDFHCKAKTLEIYGALLAAGKDPNTSEAIYDPGELEVISFNNDTIKIYFDDSKLNALDVAGGGAIGGIRFISWHEF